LQEHVQPSHREREFGTSTDLHWRSLLTGAYLSCRLFVWRGSFRGANLGSFTPSTCLLLFVVLFVADLMVFSLVGTLLYVAAHTEPNPGWFVVALWLMVPPFTQVVAAITGPMFAINEDPRLGRLFAAVTALGIANSFVLLLASFYFYRGSWHFDILEFVVACGVKMCLFVVANVHISNLEIAHDLGFMESSSAAQADFFERKPDRTDDEHGRLDRSAASLPDSSRSFDVAALDDTLLAHIQPLWDTVGIEASKMPSETSLSSNPPFAPQRNQSKAKTYVPSPF